MAELTRSRAPRSTLSLAGVALTASIVGGLVGGIAGERLSAVAQAEAAAQAERQAAAAAAEQAKWDAYGADWLRQRQQQSGASSARDAAVLRAAEEWEARYRQMYPESR